MTNTPQTPEDNNKRNRNIIIAMSAVLLLLLVVVLITIIGKKGDGTVTLSDLATPAPPQTIEATATPAPTDTPEPTAEPEYILNAKFADKFTDGEVIVTENSYQSKNIYFEIQHITVEDEYSVTYHVADIYVRDIKYFRTAFAKGEYGQGIRDSFPKIVQENNAILALTGDFYSMSAIGLVFRNGEIYRDTMWGDVFAMYNDGSMESIPEAEVDINKMIQTGGGVYQAWSFGPMLLTDGRPMEKFNQKKQIYGKNPRSAIGYYEPGHYCFVTVDGREQNDSVGMNLRELSQLFYDLGCVEAYNLDGGGSAKMMFYTEMVNSPSSSFREISDIIYLIDDEGLAEAEAAAQEDAQTP